MQYTPSTWLHSVFNCNFYFPLVQRWAAKRWRSCSTDARVCKISEFSITSILVSSQLVHSNAQSVCIAQQYVTVVIDVVANITVFHCDETPPMFCRCLLQAVTPAASHVQTSVLPPVFVFFIHSFFLSFCFQPFALCWPKASGVGFFFSLFLCFIPSKLLPKIQQVHLQALELQ